MVSIRLIAKWFMLKVYTIGYLRSETKAIPER